MPLYDSETILASFNPLQIINVKPKAVIEVSNNSRRMVSTIAVELKKLSAQSAEGDAVKKLVARSLARALQDVAKRIPIRGAAGLQHFEYDVYEPRLRVLSSSMIYLAALTRLAYLLTGRMDAELASIYLYSGHKLVEAYPQLSWEQLRRIVAEIANAGMMLIEGRQLEGLAVLGRCLGQCLPHGLPVEPSEALRDSGEAWAAALQASHLLEVGPLVDGRLLDAWGYYEVLEEELEESP